MDPHYMRSTRDSKTHSERIHESHKHCANMRTSRSISTSCIGVKSLSGEGPEQYFPISVCCTSDYCVMTGEKSKFRYECRDDNECFLYKENPKTKEQEVVQALPESSSTAEACMESYTGDDRMYPFLPLATMEDICS